VAEVELEPVPRPAAAAGSAEAPELADVIGQPEAVEALIAAAAGDHHPLMSGPPGAGKTTPASRPTAIPPPPGDEAAIQGASVRSLCGEPVEALVRRPPFEAPHHSASVAALVGGGSRLVRPGAIARATHGVLFLDEAGEFPAHALDAL